MTVKFEEIVIEFLTTCVEGEGITDPDEVREIVEERKKEYMDCLEKMGKA